MLNRDHFSRIEFGPSHCAFDEAEDVDHAWIQTDILIFLEFIAHQSWDRQCSLRYHRKVLPFR